MSTLGPPAIAGSLEALGGLVLVALVGRIVLSLFPPGAPGGHAPRRIAATWAASHLCGAIALTAEHRVLTLIGVPLQPGVGTLAWLLGPWLVVLVARRVLSPAGLVPRHEPRVERGGRTTLVALGVLTIASLAPWARSIAHAAAAPEGGPIPERCVAFVTGEPRVAAALYPASFVALVVLLAHGLACARRAPFGRYVVLALFVTTPVVQRLAEASSAATLVALSAGAGAAFAIPWLRRADRRAGALCAFCFAGAALFRPGAALLGLGALASVCLVTAAPSRRRFANGAALAWVSFALLAGTHAFLADALGDLATYRARLGSLVRASLDFETWELRWLALVPVLLVALRRVRVPAPATGPSIDRTGRELAGLLAALTLGLLAQAVGSTLDRDAALLPVATLGALAVGLALVRAERDEPSTPPEPALE